MRRNPKWQVAAAVALISAACPTLQTANIAAFHLLLWIILRSQIAFGIKV
jgi:hypothetical protein